MKNPLILCLLAVTAAVPARADIFHVNSSNLSATIPDANLNGYQNTLNIAGIGGPVQDVNVTLNISGGFDGDFYAFLSHNSSSAVLLNRVGRSNTNGVGSPNLGFGPDGSGNPFKFDDQAGQDVHFFHSFTFTLNGSGQLTGGWQSDGRQIDPLSLGSAFPGAARDHMLDIFNGGDPNGAWTLFVADVSGGSQGTLVNWGLEITAVPEPGCVALLALGLVSLGFRKLHPHRPPT